MTVECEVWLDEKTEVGRYAFDQLPRAGDTISLPGAEGEGYQHFRVDSATHRAAGHTLKAATYLFVSKDSAAAPKSGKRGP